MRHSMFGGSRRISMEELLEEGRAQPPVVEEVETAIDVALRPDPEAIEAETAMAEAADELADNEADVVELREAAEHLEAVREQLEESLEENGLDRVGAAVVTHSVGRALSRIGTDIHVPSMESYGSASNRIHSTRLTMEAIGGKIKEIWEAIKQALAKAWEATKRFFTTLFNNTARVRDQAEKLKAAAPQATGTPTVQKVTAKGAGARLASNGKVDNNWFTVVVGTLASGATSTENMQYVAQLFTDVAAKVKSGTVDEKAIGDIIASYLKDMSAVTNLFKVGGGRAVPSANIPGVDNSKSNITLSAVLPGNAVFYAATAKAAGSLAEVVGASKVGFFQLPERGEVSDEFPIMPSAAMGDLADAIIAACDAITKHKGETDKMMAAGSDLMAAGDALISGKSEEEAAAAQAVLQALPRMQENIGAWPKQLTNYLLAISSASMAVAKASLEAYKGAAAPADAAALNAPAATA